MTTRVLCGGLVAAILLIPAPETDMDAVGVPVMLLRLHDLAAVAALLAACLLIGSFVLRSRLQEWAGGLLAITVFLVAGGGVIGAILTFTGLLGLFQPAGVVITVALAAATVGSPGNLSALRHQGLRAMREVVSLGEAKTLRLLPVISIALLVYTLLTALGPTTSWDGPMYHVSLPREFLSQGRIFLPPDNLHVAFVGSPQMLNAVALAAGAESGPAVIQWVWTALLLALVVATLIRWVSPAAGAWGALLFWAYPILPLVGSSDLVDMSMTVALITLVLVVVERLDANGSRSDGILIGVLGGAAASTKYQALGYLAALGATVFLWVALRRVGVHAGEVGAAVVIAFLMLSPHLVRNIIHLGAPFYPFLADPVYPQWLSGLVPGRTLSLSGSYGILGSAREPFGLGRWVAAPGSLTPEALGSHYGLPPLFLAGLLGFFTPLRRRLVMLLLAVGGGMLFILLVSTTVNLRYFLPAAPVAVILLAVAVEALVRKVSRHAQAVVIGSVAVVAGLSIQGWMVNATMPSARALAGAGVMSGEEFLDRPANISERRAHILGDALLELGASERTPGLLFYEGRGDLIDAPVLQDNVFTNWVMLEEALGGECIPSDSMGFVVKSLPTLVYLQSRGVSNATLGEDSFRSFAERCLTLVETVEGYEVYAVR